MGYRYYILGLWVSQGILGYTLGVENISDELIRSLNQGRKRMLRAGLVTNQTGRDQAGNRTVDILRKKHISVSYMFTSEHGFDGKIGASKSVTHSTDAQTGIPIISLYKDGRIHTIQSEHIKDCDVLFFDMQDSGMRHYTIITTLSIAMKVAASYKRPIVVLDRPNPLGPHMEGPLVDDALISSISVAPIPLRHGMTVGELAWFFNAHLLEKPAQLHVVKMKQYSRNTKIAPLPVPLSPNVHCVQSCYGYSFLGLLGDIRPVDTALETGDSFQCITLHNQHHTHLFSWDRLRSILSRSGVQSRTFSYMSNRRKTFSQKDDQLYSGVKLSIADINVVKSFALTLDIVDFFKEMGIQFSFSPSLDKAAGTPLFRKYCLGTCSRAVLAHKVNSGLEQFMQKARDSFMYSPEPLIVKLK